MEEKTSVKEYKKFCKNYISKECEDNIIKMTILTGHRVGGAAKSQGDEYFSSTIKCIACINENNEPVQKDIRLTYYLNNKKPLKFLDVDKLSVYSVVCKKIKDKDFYYLLKIKRIKDKRFDEIIQEQLKPIIKVIEGISFTFNRIFSTYEGHMILENKKLSVGLEPDRNSNDATHSISTLKKIKSNFKNFYQTVLKNCSKDIVKWANDWKSEDDNHKITAAEIEKRIDKNNIVMEINGSSFTIYFEDDNLFFGHTIVYYGNIDENKFRVDIAG